MEVELSLDLINSCNFTRKRQAAMESCTEVQSKKRPCLEDSFWGTENASNLETENRLLNCTQPMVIANQLHECTDQPLSDHNSASYSHMDINCNILYQVNNTQEMDISCDATIIRSPVGLHQQNYATPTLLVQNHSSSSTSCVRCLRGEPGHINHLSS